MDNIDNLSCNCKNGGSNGVFKRTIEDEKFSVFGSLTKNNSIILRYFGNLTKDIAKCTSLNETEIYMYYIFDNNWHEKNERQMVKCLIGQKNYFCINLDLKNHDLISFGFHDNKGRFDLKEDNVTFSFPINNDVISDIMKRYGFEQNEELPTIFEQKDINIIKGENIFLKFKNLIKRIFLFKSNKAT